MLGFNFFRDEKFLSFGNVADEVGDLLYQNDINFVNFEPSESDLKLIYDFVREIKMLYDDKKLSISVKKDVNFFTIKGKVFSERRSFAFKDYSHSLYVLLRSVKSHIRMQYCFTN